MSLKIIDRNIRSITGNISKLNDLIASTGLLILNHANDHGDCTRALVLVKAMPASFRRNLLIAWFERNSPIRLNLNNDKVGMLKADAKGYTPFDLDAATAVPFYVEQAKPERVATVLNTAAVDQQFANFVKRLEKSMEAGVSEQDRPAIEARLEALRALVTFNPAVKASATMNVSVPVESSDPNNVVLAPIAPVVNKAA